jgi:hypothetical protein
VILNDFMQVICKINSRGRAFTTNPNGSCIWGVQFLLQLSNGIACVKIVRKKGSQRSVKSAVP